jgi:hypothetical protein
MTAPDVLSWVEKIHRFAELHPDGYRMHMDQGDLSGGWPLPWYLSRSFPNYHWRGGDMHLDDSGVLILSPEWETSLKAQLAAADQSEVLENFVSYPMTLHSSSALQVYVRKTLWEQYLSRQPWPPLAVQQ